MFGINNFFTTLFKDKIVNRNRKNRQYQSKTGLLNVSQIFALKLNY